MNQTYIGLDFGTKKLGLATGNLATGYAQPIQTLALNKGILLDPHPLDALCQLWQPVGFVLGKPLTAQGGKQPILKQVLRFQTWLLQRYQLPVYLQDERYSSTSAKEHLFQRFGKKGLQKGLVDAVAAAMILEHFLTTHPIPEHSSFKDGAPGKGANNASIT